jgi:hypothetical protein
MLDADSFAKRSKPTKSRGLYLGLAIFIIILGIGAVNYYLRSAEHEPRLSLRQAVNIFAKEDIYLTKTIDPDAEEINGVKPTTFFINYTDNKVHIYNYNSIAERKTAFRVLAEKDRFFYREPYTNAKNMMFFIVPVDEKQITMEDWILVNRVYKTVFEKLNDTQEIIFTGAGENWESQTKVKYYKYFYYNENSALGCDCYYLESSCLKYLGQDIESVGEISYKEQRSNGSGSGSGRTLNPDGTVNLGSTGGNGSIPRAEEEITFTVRWNGQEESFIARSK